MTTRRDGEGENSLANRPRLLANQSSTIANGRKYGYDVSGSRTYRDIDSSIYAGNNKDQAYTYVGLDRLKTYDGGTLSGTTITGTPVAEQDWGLDALGNWGTYTQKASGSATLNQTRSHNTANEISTIGITAGGTGTDWIDPTYDLAGNRVTGPYPLSPNLSLTMTYDAWNRLVRVQLGGSIQIFAAEYDGLGRRIVRTDEGMTRRSYYNESWKELEVRKEASAGVEDTDPMEQFVWHPYYIDALATRFYDATTGGTQVQHYFTHDANFNITSAINTSGAVIERYDYTPYGQPFILEPNFSADPDGTDIGNGYLYTGRYYDRVLGLYHYRHRTYDPAVGTFLTRDPIGYEGSKGNLYEYVSSIPTIHRDWSGLAATVIPTTPYWKKFCEDFCAKKGEVTAGPITTRYDYRIGGISFGTQATDCRCRPCPADSGKCTGQELAYLQTAKDIACLGAGKPRIHQPCDKLAALIATNTACAAARQAVQTKCFPGNTDKIHADLIKQHEEWAKQATEFYNKHNPPCLPLNPIVVVAG